MNIEMLKYCHENAPDIMDAFREIKQASLLSENPVVTVIGLYNAGKSSLLNVLTHHLDREHFKTGRVRETRAVTTHTHEQVDYVDTPGLDAEYQDDQVAFEAVTRSDILLLCHSASLGELDAPILAYLERIQSQSQRPLSERLLCVVTKAEQTDAEQAVVLGQIRQQLQALCGQPPSLFLVSSAMYRRGVIEHKNALIRGSGMPNLMAFLTERTNRERAQLKALRQARLREQVEHLQLALDAQIQESIERLHRQVEEANALFRPLGDALVRSRELMLSEDNHY